MTAPELSQAELGERLRISRQFAGLSQQQVAEATSIPRTAVSDIERGMRRVDSLELKALAALYGEELAHFLGVVPRTLSGPEALAQRLEAVTTNLHGYLEQRGRELAEPHIAVAEEAAAQRVAQAEHDLGRERDLSVELRRQLRYALRRAQRAEHESNPDIKHRNEDCEQCRPPAPVSERTER